MGSKKQIIAVALLVSLLGAGGVGYSWRQDTARANTFNVGGYIHLSDPERVEKRVAFQSGSTWRKGISDMVSFEDTQGNQQQVSRESFAHYDDRSLSALTDGVVVDLNDLDTAQVTNHYAISPAVTFQSSGDGYSLSNGTTDLTFSDFLWKISENKYMPVSSDIQLCFAEDDVRDAENYVEITYIDEGVIQLQTEDNVWQTISNVCYATLDNGEVVDVALKNVQDAAGEVLTDFSKLVLDSDNNVEVTPLTEELENVKESVIPHFDITAEQGKDGAAGESGAPGESGEAGEAGQPGEAGEAGAQGAAGQAGANGAAGASGTNGAAGAPGSPGAPGDPGATPDTPDTEVLALPEFTIQDWNPTATGCSGTIMVTDPKGMIQENSDTMYSRVYVVDALTGVEVGEAFAENGERFAFRQTLADGYAFTFSGLAPDREYILMTEAPIDTNVGDKGPYVRNFITKTFYTDSVGAYMEAGQSKAELNGTTGEINYSVAVNAFKQSYLGDVANAYIYLYSTRSAAEAATADALGVSLACSSDLAPYLNDPDNEYAWTRFGDLDSNTAY